MSDLPPVSPAPDPAPAPQGEPSPPQTQPARYPFWTYVDVLLLAAVAVPMLIASFVVAALMVKFLPGARAAKALGPITATFFFYGLWFFALYQVIHVRYRRPFWRSLAWVRTVWPAWTSALLGLGVAMGCILITIVLRPPAMQTPLDQLFDDPASVLLLGIFAVTLGPLCEELAFRGFLMPLLVRSLGPISGVLLQAVPFTLLHGFEYAWSWQRLIIIFLAGASFGWIRHVTGSTAAATWMHGAYNLTFFAGLLAERFVVHR